MKRNKKLEKYMKLVIDKYKGVLLLDRFTFTTSPDPDEGTNAIYSCAFVYPYLNADIQYSLHAVKDFKEDKGNRNTESIIVHEMCHLITDPLFSKAIQRYVSEREIKDERERLTDHICNIVLNLNELLEEK